MGFCGSKPVSAMLFNSISEEDRLRRLPRCTREMLVAAMARAAEQKLNRFKLQPIASAAWALATVQ